MPILSVRSASITEAYDAPEPEPRRRGGWGKEDDSDKNYLLAFVASE